MQAFFWHAIDRTVVLEVIIGGYGNRFPKKRRVSKLPADNYKQLQSRYLRHLPARQTDTARAFSRIAQFQKPKQQALNSQTL